MYLKLLSLLHLQAAHQALQDTHSHIVTCSRLRHLIMNSMYHWEGTYRSGGECDSPASPALNFTLNCLKGRKLCPVLEVTGRNSIPSACDKGEILVVNDFSLPEGSHRALRIGHILCSHAAGQISSLKIHLLTKTHRIKVNADKKYFELASRHVQLINPCICMHQADS